MSVARTLTGSLRVAALLVLCVGTDARAEPPRIVELTARGEATALERADVNGDGVTDLVLGIGRELRIWAGAKGKRPGAAPSWILQAPAEASFAEVLRPGPDGVPRLALLGRGKLLVHGPGAKKGPPATELAAIPWADADRVTLVQLAQPDGSLLLPDAEGWRLVAADGTVRTRLPLPTSAHVGVPGPFLEDTTSVIHARPHVELGIAASAEAPATRHTLWAIAGRGLRAQSGTTAVTYDLGFLPRAGDRELLDLDGDGRPDVVHIASGGTEMSLACFRTRPVPVGKPAPVLTPANCALTFAGSRVAHDFVDLDGDGHRDLVATTIAVDWANALRAMTAGVVSAQTRAFRNLAGEGGGPDARWFATEPSASIASEVKIRISFTYAGTVDIRRQVTIVVDGDYDGDGRKDLAIRTDAGTVSIWPGLAGGRWGATPRTIEIPPIGTHRDVEGYAYDADGDGKDELLLLYRAGPDAPERLFLVSAR